jgi:hypothetical protein
VPAGWLENSLRKVVAIFTGSGTLLSMMKKQTANTTPLLVQDRKTGQWYNPQEAWLKVMESKEVREVMVRLKNR